MLPVNRSDRKPSYLIGSGLRIKRNGRTIPEPLGIDKVHAMLNEIRGAFVWVEFNYYCTLF